MRGRRGRKGEGDVVVGGVEGVWLYDSVEVEQTRWLTLDILQI